MRRMIGLVGLMTATGVCLSAQPPASAPPQPPARDARPVPNAGTARLRGRVGASETNTPLRRAIVRLSSPDSAANAAAKTGTTDAEGRFEFKDLPPGRYSVSASKPGFVSLSFGQRRPREIGTLIEVEEGRTIEHIDFALPRASAIVGRIVDEFGEAMAGVSVQALQFRYTNGQRQLAPVGQPSTTPDTGEFRLWGLMPGDYYVSARPVGGTTDRDGSGYAQTYYPNAVVASHAQRIVLAVGQEQTSVVVTLAPVKFARLSGTIVDSHGAPVGAVLLLNQLTASGSISQPFAGTVRADFSIPNVPPGDYVLDVHGGTSSGPEMARVPVSVSGENVDGISVALTRGAALRGRLAFDGDGASELTSGNVEIALGPSPSAPWQRGGTVVRPRADWTFEIPNQLGPKSLAVNLTPLAMSQTWTLKSVTLNDRDVTDTGIDFAGANLDVVVTLTTAMTELAGSVVDERNKPTGEYTIVAFAENRDRRTPLSRHVKTSRGNQQGAFAIRGLPPGEYLVVALESHDPGEESDPKLLEGLESRATKVTLGTGESKTMTLKLQR